MKYQMKTIYLFMTELDSASFLEYLQERDSICINVTPSPTPNIDIVNKIPILTKSSNTIYSIVNTSIISLKKYVGNSEFISGYYHYQQIGEGIMQFLPCSLSNYDKKCLMWGQLSISYLDENTGKWIKDILAWIKKNGEKVYRTSILRDISSDKPEKNVYSLPDASKIYNGINGRYLTMGKDLYCLANKRSPLS